MVVTNNVLKQDVLDEGYKVRIIQGSATETFFRESPRGSDMQKVYQQMKEDPSMFVKSYADAEESLKVTLGLPQGATRKEGDLSDLLRLRWMQLGLILTSTTLATSTSSHSRTLRKTFLFTWGKRSVESQFVHFNTS